jgi:hypothetical protein
VDTGTGASVASGARSQLTRVSDNPMGAGPDPAVVAMWFAQLKVQFCATCIEIHVRQARLAGGEAISHRPAVVDPVDARRWVLCRAHEGCPRTLAVHASSVFLSLLSHSHRFRHRTPNAKAALIRSRPNITVSCGIGG